MNSDVTPLSDIGVFGLIDHISKRFSLNHATSEQGIGADASVLNPGSRRVITDNILLLEGIHFDLTYFPLRHLGYKGVVSAISGIIATGTQPSQLSLSLGLSGKMSLQAVEQIMEGVAMACKNFNIDLIGFRPVSSLTGLSLAFTAYGMAEEEALLSRNGGQPNNLICVTGDLGAAYMGLQLLEREKKVLKETGQQQPDFGPNDYLLQRQLMPEARLDALKQLIQSGLRPTSMTLVRESLAASLLHICKASGTGCHIYEAKIPIDHATISLAEEMMMNPLVAALNGGEDYELLFTLSLDDYQKLENEPHLKEVFLIGHLTEAGKAYTLETNAGQEVPLEAQGWGV